MASLSNINGLFEVHSTGAILFSDEHGTTGQILRSNGDSAPTWVDFNSTGFGGNYLLLTGGVLTGNLTINGTNNLTVGGTVGITGLLTGTTGSFSGLVSGITPTAAANFATKAYVDAITPGVGVFLPLAGGALTGATSITVGTNTTTFSTTNEKLKITNSAATTASGLSLLSSNGTWQMELHGSGSNYGFLGSDWGAWNLRKALSGGLYLNNNTTYFVQPEGTSNMNAATFAGLVSGITPTATANFTTKAYVDAAVAGVPQGDITAISVSNGITGSSLSGPIPAISMSGNYTGNFEVTGNINIPGTNNSYLINSIQLANWSYFGYSTGYPGIVIGNTSGQSLFFNVDPVGNPSGSFTGDGREYVYRNVGSFITPNATNNGYNTILGWDTSGGVTFSSGTTFNGDVTITGNLFLPTAASYIKLGGYSFIGEDLIDNDSLTIASHYTESIYFAHENAGVYTRTVRIDPSGNLTVGNPDYGSQLGQVRIINNAATAPASLSLFGYNNVTDGTTFAKIDFAMQYSGAGGDVLASIKALSVGIGENASDLTFSTATGATLGEKMRITNDGRIGIGASTNIDGRLDLRMKFAGQNWIPDGTSAKWSEVWCSATTTGAYFNDTMLHINTDRGGGATGGVVGIAFSPGWTGHQNWGIYSFNTTGGSYSQGDLAFVNQLNDGTRLERMRFTSVGRVGIGTGNPSTLLSLSSTANNSLGGISLIGNTAGDKSNIWTQDIYSKWLHTESAVDAAGGYGRIDFETNAALNATYPTRGGFSFKTAGAGQFVTFTSEGKVGIGTSLPGAKLDVQGGEVTFSINTADKDTFLFTTGAADKGILNIKDDTIIRVKLNAAGDSYFTGGNLGIGLTNPISFGRLAVSQLYTASLRTGYFQSSAYSAPHVAYDTFTVNQQDVPCLTIVETPAGATSTHQKLTITVGDNNCVFRTSQVSGGMWFNVNGNVSSPGYQTTVGTNAIRILNNADVGIGTPTPTEKLSVKGADQSVEEILRVRTANTTYPNAGASLGVSGYEGEVNVYDSANVRRIYLSSHYNCYINPKGTGFTAIGKTSAAYTLDVDGTIRATGDVIAYSDARVKDNIKTIDNALEKTTKLRGVSYTRNDIEDKSTKIGVIAQEVLEVLPEVVSKDDEGKYSVSYGNIVGVLIEAIKELEARVKELENK